MEEYKLARVRWEVGQTLLPAHFQAQEEALQAEIRLTAALSGLPSHGVAALEWDKVLLAKGKLVISSLTAVTRKGFVIQVPGNASLKPFPLEETGLSDFTLHLHVLHDKTDAKGTPLYSEDPPILRRVIHRLTLSTQPVVDGMMDSMPLARFIQDEHKNWHLDPKWVPPLLLVGPHPFLESALGRLEKFLLRVQEQLRAHVIKDSLLHQNQRNNAYRVLGEVVRLGAQLGDMKHRVYPHPYHLFGALRSLYLETCAYLGMVPDEKLPVYDHEDIAKGVEGWLKLMARSFRPEVTHSTHKHFEYIDGRFVVSNLPEEAKSATELYLLVRHKSGESPSVEGLKLASPSRLSTVRRLALRGLPFEHVKHVDFPHALEQDMDWYRLKFKGDEEWQYALREDKLSFYATPALDKDTWVSLFWRK